MRPDFLDDQGRMNTRTAEEAAEGLVCTSCPDMDSDEAKELVQEITKALTAFAKEASKVKCCHCDCHELIEVGDGCFTCIDQRSKARNEALEEAFLPCKSGEWHTHNCSVVKKECLRFREEGHALGRAEALEEAAKISSNHECSIARGTETCTCDLEISDKIRALKSGDK